MVEESWWPLGVHLACSRTAAASSARQRLVGAGHRRGRRRLRDGLRVSFFLGSGSVAWRFYMESSLNCTTVLMSQSNRLFELSSRVVWPR